MSKYEDLDISVTVAGIKFRNPFYVSSGPTTMTIEQLEKIDEYGWGGASLKLTIDPEPYINRRPRYGYYPDKTFLAFTAEKRLLLDELLRLIEQGRKRAENLILWSNITYSGEKGIAGWVNMAKKCEDAGAHINELNMCCPNMSFNVELTGKNTDGPKTGASLGQNKRAIADIAKAIKEETTIPLFVKITPEGGEQAQIAKAALDAGADACGGNANRLGIPPINLDNPTQSTYYLQKEIGMACMNGPWLKPLALRDVYTMRKVCGSHAVLTGTGGISTWRDAVEMMMCGADIIGICTATLTKGLGFMPEFIIGFKKYMSEKKYKYPRDMRDILVPAITSAPDLTIYAGYAKKSEDNLVAPCTFACPNSVPAQGYVRKVADAEFEEAYNLIMSRSPLQSICGKVCDSPCEAECTRAIMDEPIMIRDIKRFVIEMAEEKGWKPNILDTKGQNKNKKVAVIGSGPAGLGCAYDLARAGYKTTIFEARSEPGGMLSSCIPSFRLSRKDIEKEINIIKELGVGFNFNIEFGKDINIQSLKKDGYEAIFLGIGAQDGGRSGIRGEKLENCITSIDFLTAVSRGDKVKIGKRVAVVGGGFTAIDSARTAVRLGADEVFILYRRTAEQMPACPQEVKEAEEEGVKIMYLVSPQEITGKEKVKGIRLLNYVLGETDNSQRRVPVEMPGTEFNLDVDMVIFAISQQVRTDMVPDIKLTSWETIQSNEKTCETEITGVYAGGDCARGPADVITAIADGKRAAASIDIYLSANHKAFLEYDAEKVMVDKNKVLERAGNKVRKKRISLKIINSSERKNSFDEYAGTLTQEQAVEEASRCLICGCGAGCEICKDICKVFAWQCDCQGKTGLDKDKCLGCGMCIHRCPNNNIEMVQTGTENLI